MPPGVGGAYRGCAGGERRAGSGDRALRLLRGGTARSVRLGSGGPARPGSAPPREWLVPPAGRGAAPAVARRRAEPRAQPRHAIRAPRRRGGRGIEIARSSSRLTGVNGWGGGMAARAAPARADCSRPLVNARRNRSRLPHGGIASQRAARAPGGKPAGTYTFAPFCEAHNSRSPCANKTVRAFSRSPSLTRRASRAETCRTSSPSPRSSSPMLVCGALGASPRSRGLSGAAPAPLRGLGLRCSRPGAPRGRALRSCGPIGAPAGRPAQLSRA
jgi:hypothetical protein